MFDGAESDGVGNVACALFSYLTCTLILEGLALCEGKSGAKVVACVVGVVALCLIPELLVGSVCDYRHFFAVEVEGYIASVVVCLDESIRAIAHKDHTLIGVSKVDEA